MSKALERLVNLALFLAEAKEPVSAARVRAEVAGYPPGQDEAAFLRMFERDKDDLRRMGFALEVDDAGRYRLDASATYAATVDLTPPEVAAVRVAASALLSDPSFPYAADLRLALAKVAAASGRMSRASALIADEVPEQQARTVSTLTSAIEARKTVDLSYENALGEKSERAVEPYGLFMHDGRWYLVARDVEKDALRTFAVARILEARPNQVKPRTPDFEPPPGFDVSDHVSLPFQIGTQRPVEALVRFSPAAAWRAGSVSAGHGRLERNDDGSVDWHVAVASLERFAAFVVENGPGLQVLAPPAAIETLETGLEKAATAHG